MGIGTPDKILEPHIPKAILITWKSTGPTATVVTRQAEGCLETLVLQNLGKYR